MQDPQKHVTSGDYVRVKPSEYRRAGEVGRVIGAHPVLQDYAWVAFRNLVQPDLIELSHLEPVPNINAV